MSQPFSPLYDRKALREVESRASSSLGDDFALMQRAGLAAWHCVLANWPRAQTILVACGPGNNGGDGYVLARHAREAGRQVRVLRLPAHSPRSEPARRAEREYREAGGQVEEYSGAIGETGLVVDALFGIGLSRAPEADVAAMIAAIDATSAPVLALDVPSGVDAETGGVPGAAIHAARTLQFIAAHAGLATGAALEHVGMRDVASLGVANELRDIVPLAHALGPGDLQTFLQPRRRNTHKGESGRVLCIGGDHGKGGAIVLCAEAALRSGAGLVEVATRAEHVGALLARCPETMPHAIDRDDALRPSLAAADVVAIGPGLGQEAWGKSLHSAAIDSDRALVIDADALNLLAANAAIALLPQAVLTPHPSEAARLLGIPTHEVQADRLAAARAMCAKFGCIVVLKGAGTVIVAPERTPRIIDAGNPGMAVGGMGDVLTGVIAALRAQGMQAFDAASCGALLHAVAGDAAARDGGERGLLPSDLFAQLRRLANPCQANPPSTNP